MSPLPADGERCVALCLDTFHQYRCTRRGTVERAGKRYCKQHDPVARREKQEAQRAAYKAKVDAYEEELKDAQALVGALGVGRVDYPRMGQPAGVSLTLEEATRLYMNLDPTYKASVKR